MAYSDQKQNRVVAMGSVALIHVGLGAALLTGLAVKFNPAAPKPPTTIYDVPVDEPPEPTPPPPEPLERITPREPITPPITVPVPTVRTPNMVDLTTTTVIYPPLPPTVRIDPPAPPTPSSPAVNLSSGAQPRGNQGDWFPQDSYPAAARRAGAEGRVSVSVDVGTNGRITACRVTASSGNADLDGATCRLATRNGRFEPARDAAGEPVASTTALRNVRWRLQE